MPLDGYSVGRDITVSIVRNGTNFNLQQLAHFDSRQIMKEDGVDDLTTGYEHQIAIPQRWEGTIMFNRMDASLDNFIAAYEQAYYSGQNIQNATMVASIGEPSGAVRKYKFLGVTFVMEEAGKWNLQEVVKQGLRFRARTRLVI